MHHSTLREGKRTGRGLRLVIALALCALTLGAKLWYPRPAQALRPWLFGQADNRVMLAFAALGSSLEQGDGLGQAVQAFCAEMSGDGLS